LPVTSKVFLSNFILNFQLENQQKLSPYIGAGIGAAVMDIKNADSTQTSPLEVGINHFNSNPNSSDTAFAAQLKFGTTYQITQHISAFFEYRWLYTASSQYLFGSTVYTTHGETAPWKVNLGSQQYNMGLIGMRYSA
jgi:opacity protein-like surface antigen